MYKYHQPQFICKIVAERGFYEYHKPQSIGKIVADGWSYEYHKPQSIVKIVADGGLYEYHKPQSIVKILSLNCSPSVRNGEDGDVGFMADRGRRAVALSRAKDQLYIIGEKI